MWSTLVKKNVDKLSSLFQFIGFVRHNEFPKCKTLYHLFLRQSKSNYFKGRKTDYVLKMYTFEIFVYKLNVCANFFQNFCFYYQSKGTIKDRNSYSSLSLNLAVFGYIWLRVSELTWSDFSFPLYFCFWNLNLKRKVIHKNLKVLIEMNFFCLWLHGKAGLLLLLLKKYKSFQSLGKN